MLRTYVVSYYGVRDDFEVMGLGYIRARSRLKAQNEARLQAATVHQLYPTDVTIQSCSVVPANATQDRFQVVAYTHDGGP